MHGSYANNNSCGIWTRYIYDGSGALVEVTSSDAGPCSAPLLVEEAEVFDATKDPETVHSISGMLRAREDGMPVIGATVSSDRGPSATTGNQGEYSLDLGSEARHRITVSHPMYYSVNTEIDLGSSQKRIFNGTMRRRKETDNPVVTGVQSSAGSVFFEGLSAQNTYTVSVDWQTSTPKELLITRNGNSEVLAVNAGSASVSYTMDTMFNTGTSTSANTLSFQALDAVGFRSNVETLHPRIVSVPPWLQSLGQFAQAVHAGNVYSYKLTATWPQQPLDLQLSPETLGNLGWNAWSLVPLVGGQPFGLRSTQAVVEGELKTDGTGGVYFGGQTGFAAAGQSITGKVGGKGTFDIPANRGLEWAKGALLLSLEGQIEKEVGPVELIPALGNAVNWPVVGGPLRWFNSTATFKGTILSGFDLELDLIARDALSFSRSEGAIRSGISIALESGLSKNLKLGFSGGGEIKAVFHVPAVPEVVKSVSAEIYARLTVNVFMFSSDFTASHTFEYPRSGGNMAAEPLVLSTVNGFRPIDTTFARSVSYFSVNNSRGMLPAFIGDSGTVAEAVSAFASPVGASSSTGQLVAAVFIDTAKPALQSAEIQLLSFSTPASVTTLRLTDDTQADMEPTIVVSGSTSLLAWSRVKEPLFSEDGTLEEMAAAMEIVLQQVDNGTIQGQQLLLTDNAWMDHSPQLIEADNGIRFLFWQSNSANLLLGTEAHPTRVHYLNASIQPSATAVETIPYNFIHCPQLRYALDQQRNPLVLFEKDQDGDPSTRDDRSLLLLRKITGTWQSPQTISEAGTSFGAFTAVGMGQNPTLLWVAEDGLHLYPVEQPDAHQLLPLPGDVAVTSLQISPTSASGILIVATQPVHHTKGSSVFMYGYDLAQKTWAGPAELTFEGEIISDISLSSSFRGWIDILYLAYPQANLEALPDLRAKKWSFEPRLAIVQPSITAEVDQASRELVITGEVFNRDFTSATDYFVRVYPSQHGVPNPRPFASVALDPLAGSGKQTFELRLTTDNPASYGKLILAATPNHSDRLSGIPDNLQAVLPGRQVPWDIDLLATRMEHLSSTRTALTTVLMNNGPENASAISVALVADGKELQRRSVAGIYAGKQNDLAFEFSPAEDLLHPVALMEVVVDPDNLAIDTHPLNNRRAFRVVHPGLWGKAAFDAGRADVNGFGSFAVFNNGLGHRTDTGWVYPVGHDWSDVYFYDYQRGQWWWSSHTIYPWRYYPAENVWRHEE
jgi:hypothetical protein